MMVLLEKLGSFRVLPEEGRRMYRLLHPLGLLTFVFFVVMLSVLTVVVHGFTLLVSGKLDDDYAVDTWGTVKVLCRNNICLW